MNKGVLNISRSFLVARVIFKIYVCSPACSLPQQSSSSGDLLPEMMESETPPQISLPDKADDAEVSSRRILPDLQVAQGTVRTGAKGNTSAAQGPGCAAPTGNNKSPGLSNVQGTPDALMDILQHASISEEHRTLMGTVLERVRSVKSGLNEAFSSLLRGFEVRSVISIIL